MSAPAPPPRPITPVAVGVLVRADGAVLLADRPAGKPYAGYWEFPGGKVEPGETIEQALARELGEELGVRLRESEPWVTTQYEYPHAHVRLHFRRVFEWSGSPHPAEGQRLMFLAPGATPPEPLLPAAVPALRWAELPAMLGLSPGSCTAAAQAEEWAGSVLARGLRHVLWHEPALESAALASSLRCCREMARAFGARMFVDARDAARLRAGEDPPADAFPPDAFLDCAALRAASLRPAAGWLGAGVREPGDLERAASLGCDFALLEPDPDAPATAVWEQVGALCARSPLPVYAPLPPDAQVLRRARRLGAHGLAARVAV